MNPLMFADWRRLDGFFTGLMWGVALVLVCLTCAVAVNHPSRCHRAASRKPVCHHATAVRPAGSVPLR